jgi:HEAT repeat protein
VHAIWQAYFASRQLVASEAELLRNHAEDPRWAEVLRFYAEMGDMAPVVAAYLSGPKDLLRTRMMRVSEWVSVAPDGAAWRDGAMAGLARGFLEPGIPDPLRRSIARRLADSNVTGVKYFLRQALQHPDVKIRASALAGLGRIATEADIDVFEATITNEEGDVRLSAVEALAEAGTAAATRLLERLLLHGDDPLLPAVARALARCGTEGLAFLEDAAVLPDVAVRRAAVLGLAEGGAETSLRRIAVEDDQWIVRSAATEALSALERGSTQCGIAPPPVIAELPWLITWVAARGQGLGRGSAAKEALWRVIEEGEVSTSLAALAALTHAGGPEDVERLQPLVLHSEPEIAAAAFEAFEEISLRYDLCPAC